MIALVLAMAWEDSIVAMIGAFLLLLFALELATRNRCTKGGHRWAKRFDHETQRMRYRCEVCRKWEGFDLPW